MLDAATPPGSEGPITVSVSRRVRPGHQAAYETWLHGIVEAATEFPGHQGVSILRPSSHTAGRYVLIYRFDSWAHAEAWEASPARASWIARLAGLVEDEGERKRVTGLETWFDLPEVPAAAHAPRWKMALVLIAVVFVIVYPLQLLVLPLTTGWPHPLRTLAIAVVQVLLMTHLVMPRVTALLKPWLFRPGSG